MITQRQRGEIKDLLDQQDEEMFRLAMAIDKAEDPKEVLLLRRRYDSTEGAYFAIIEVMKILGIEA